MIYEFKVNELAEEFGVHRNTIRNWIKSGSVKAKPGPGRQYIMQWADYQAFCEKFGRKPRISPNQDLAMIRAREKNCRGGCSTFRPGFLRKNPLRRAIMGGYLPDLRDLCLGLSYCRGGRFGSAQNRADGFSGYGR
ncbi:MAG: helix-turn-helix domain-containing protein [Desulfobulbaceae bacterium]|nr:MAG: helix-turn-helix domain-containing protein [Desulfobulbaceae bacterium]